MKSILKSKEDLIRDQRGVTLLIVLVMSVLLVVLGLSMTVNSMTEFSMSHELLNKKIASLTANAGLVVATDKLLGASLDTLLAATTSVPKYINYSEPTSGSDAETYFNNISNPLLNSLYASIRCSSVNLSLGSGILPGSTLNTSNSSSQMLFM